MASGGERDEPRWPALFRRSREPIFVLNHRRQLVFANPAWEALTGVSAADARGLVCTRRATGHPLADLGRTLVPPRDAIEGRSAQARRPFPGTATGPPWWDIDFLPLNGESGVTAIVGCVRKATAAPTAPRATMPAAWAEWRGHAQRAYTFSAWESSHPEIRRAIEQARLAATSGCRAIIVGATGAGKETLARTIHSQSNRRELPCIALDCSQLPAAAIRGVLFGPFGLKHPDWSGLIYLNEPARLPLGLQAELAAAIADRPQVLAGCTEDPQGALTAGTLQAELFAALSVLVIQLPSLAARKDDLPKFADLMLQRAAEMLGKPIRTLSPDAMQQLQSHPWTENFDELARTMFGVMAKDASGSIEVGELPLSLRQGAMAANKAVTMTPLDKTLEEVERRAIAKALKRAKGNKSKAADLLGVWRPRLLRRMEALGMSEPEGTP
ncbi:MAG: sigma 54-interacting transcriptional regulator [Gemmataceae bacterium]